MGKGRERGLTLGFTASSSSLTGQPSTVKGAHREDRLARQGQGGLDIQPEMDDNTESTVLTVH